MYLYLWQMFIFRSLVGLLVLLVLSSMSSLCILDTTPYLLYYLQVNASPIQHAVFHFVKFPLWYKSFLV